ncbi:substance-K receptor-like [Mytilus trossulus]|uniref:substance-K receptor-like n=1 Tax=Mytilus trossulus TaxID=6551 RepID=UPI0030054800
MSGKCENTATVSDEDLLNTNFIGELKKFPAWETAVKIAVVAAVDLVAIIGNILIIFIVVHSKKMRTATNFYIVNLSIADLLVACFPIWIHLVDDVTEGWVVGAYFCKFNPFIQITAMCASIFTLVAIAGDRFFAIMFPLKSRVTQRRVSLVMVIIWTCAAAIGMPALFFYKYTKRQWKDFLERFCSDVWPQTRNSDGECDNGYRSKSAYWVCVLVVLNWIPMVIMIVMYTIILVRLGKRRIIPSSGALSTSAIQQRSKQKVVMMLFAILIAFIVCAIPFQVTKLFELFRSDRRQSLPDWYNPLYFIAVTLLYTNSALNPIIYSGLNENFMTSFRSLIKTVCKRKPKTNRCTNKNTTEMISIVDSRRGSKASMLESLADEQHGTFRYITNKKQINPIRNSIP